MEYTVREYEGFQKFYSPKIKIDTSKKHVLKAKFKSIGKVKSKLYFGVACYDESEKLIPSTDVCRKPSACTITEFTENTIQVDVAASDWAGGSAKSNLKLLGFYYDGNTQRFPDFVWIRADKDDVNKLGIYNTFEGNTLQLNIPLPDTVSSKIQKNVTKVCNHFSSGTYTYSAASGVEVPDEWAEYSATIQGEGWNEDRSKFRINTKSISIVVLANYEQQKDATLIMKDLELSTVLYS